MRLVLVVPLLSLLAACQTETSPERLAIEAEGQRIQATLNVERVDPLWPICLAAVETGKSVSDETMASLGYTRRFGDDFFKPLGNTTLARLNGAELYFRAANGECAISPIVGSFSAYSDYILKSLSKRGYSKHSYEEGKRGRPGSYVFIKANSSIKVLVGWQGGLGGITIKRN